MTGSRAAPDSVGAMSQVPPPATPEESPSAVVPYCYRHPKRETYLRCVRCDRPICPECLREAPVGYQCPECVAEGRRTVRPARTVFGGSALGARGYVTKALIFINVAVMIASVATARGGGIAGGGLGGLLGGITPLTEWGSVWGVVELTAGRGGPVVAVVPVGIADGEYYRLLTSMFLHYGLLHLALNMWALWVLGRELESSLGPGRFLTLYLLSGLGGSVAAYLFAPEAMSAGASGAIYGLFAALFVVFRRLNRDTSAIITVLVINLIFSFSVRVISIEAHLGGLVMGAAIGVALAYAPRALRNKVLVASVAASVLILSALTVIQTAAINSAAL
jgi:membrane associated rhomboid family serine protease